MEATWTSTGESRRLQGDPDWSYDDTFEREIIRKLDWHIIPIVVLVYLFSFLDRVNIGNARLYGLEKDLDLIDNRYQVAVSLFFVTYLLFELPSNLVLKKFTASRYIASLAVLWSIVASLTGLVKTYHQLLVCRILLGIFEAGLFPGLAVYLTFFYTRSQLALRIGYLAATPALAGACGAPYGIGHLDGTGGKRGWRWIMILEGIPSFFLGIVTFFFLADNPSQATYLTPSEREFLRLRRLREQGETANAQKFHWEDVKKTFLDWRVIAFAIAQFGVDTMLYGFSIFLPTIIQHIGHWSTPVTQLTIPCYFLGALSFLTVAYLADRTQRRGPFCVVFGCIAIIGYIILLSSHAAGVQYFGCFVVAFGLYIVAGLPLSWLPVNTPRYGKRAAGSGLQLTVGNSSGVMVPFLYTKAPRFIKGHAVSLAMVAAGTTIYGILWYSYMQVNKARARGDEEKKIVGMTGEEIDEMGDESPRFRYIE
ncbi:hypothetical protein BS47DRAFT_1304370 [Hydnum rufescens UP504]|uniref:Major facilitator superfamily (MFS) profile domain-containing protein n=1 Tax=Hydnum rufescens UP504 TaxID=1448309 RepID=A0A9P6ALU3_9AGAM|nr:hypothetical protein BS47DRAFT_1304370 [Hydnum rufescens UP504]